MHRDVYEFLQKNGVECKYDDVKDEIRFCLKINDVEYELYMKFPEYYPYEFPEIFIEDTKNLAIPHIYIGNRLCLYDTNEVLPEPEKYLENALECIFRTKKLLLDSQNNDNILDYQLEWASFWEAKSVGQVDFLGSRNLETRLLWKYELLDDWSIVAEQQDKIMEFINNSYDLKPKNVNFERVLFVNIGKKLLMTLKCVKDIQELIPKSDISLFYRFLIMNSGKGMIILYADNGMGKLLLSLEIELFSNRIKISSRNIQGILAANKSRKFKRFRTKNYQMQRLFTRGGDGSACFDKKCLLIGCGSVGSYLSKAMIDIGITDDMTLLDNDFFEIENLARHLCGSDHLCLSVQKAEALKLELLKHYPAMVCNSISENAWAYILNRYRELNKFDIILVCVGNTVIEKRIMQLIKEKKLERECIILWVEPYLIAGHAVVFQREIDESTEKNLLDINGMFNSNVLVNSRKYLKSEAGCQSAYAPYAGFEVQKFVLDFIDIYYRKIYQRKEKCNYEFTWIGKMKWARQQQFEIKSKWRAKDDRFMELRRIDSQ